MTGREALFILMIMPVGSAVGIGLLYLIGYLT